MRKKVSRSASKRAQRPAPVKDLGTRRKGGVRGGSEPINTKPKPGTVRPLEPVNT
jgi:hypothetical protein